MTTRPHKDQPPPPPRSIGEVARLSSTRRYDNAPYGVVLRLGDARVGWSVWKGIDHGQPLDRNMHEHRLDASVQLSHPTHLEMARWRHMLAAHNEGAYRFEDVLQRACRVWELLGQIRLAKLQTGSSTTGLLLKRLGDPLARPLTKVPWPDRHHAAQDHPHPWLRREGIDPGRRARYPPCCPGEPLHPGQRGNPGTHALDPPRMMRRSPCPTHPPF